MFKSMLWGLILGGGAGLAVLGIVYLPGFAYGVTQRELLEGFQLLVAPALVGGLLLGAAAGLLHEKRRLRLLLLAFGLYPLLTIGTIAVLGHTLAWQTLLVAAFMAFAYFPIVFVPVGAGVLALERLTRLSPRT